MAVSFDQLNELADLIIYQRKKLIFDSYFGDVTKQTYEKYFTVQGKAKTPYLKEGVYGHKWYDGEGHVHYQMLQKGRWQYRKVGKKRKPMKSEMKRQYQEGENLIKMNEKQSMNFKELKTYEGKDGIKVVLSFENKLPAMSRKASELALGEFQGAEKEWKTKKDPNVKFSSFDKELNKAIDKWAQTNGLKVIVERGMI